MSLIFYVGEGETRSLLPHLFRFTDEHRAEGLALQRDVAAFETELKAALEEVWARPPPEGEDGEDAEPIEGWASRMAEKEKSARVNPLDKVMKPDISHATRDWRLPLYDLNSS